MQFDPMYTGRYMIDNTSTYKTAFTKDELKAAIWRAEQGIKREIDTTMNDAIVSVLENYLYLDSKSK